MTQLNFACCTKIAQVHPFEQVILAFLLSGMMRRFVALFDCPLDFLLASEYW